MLNTSPKVGWVTAGKLLARKRPHLIPIYDTVVRCYLSAPASFWTSRRTALRADDHQLIRHLDTLRSDADVPATVSAIRILDVAIWMHHHHTDHRNGQCHRDDTPASVS